MRFDNLPDWLRWQGNLHPSAVALGLERVARVWERMGHGSPPFPVITVAGTNGKGSSAAMLEAVYGAAGYRTACYTSPHLLRYTERIRIGGVEVGEAALCRAFARVDAVRADDSLTYFEFGTLAAVDLFVRAEPEVAILEVGLGGRLDAVNLFDADLALITSIGRDHTAWLGDTLEAIAAEKAGILRHGRPAVIGHRDPLPVLVQTGKRLGCPTYVLGREFDWERGAWDWQWTGPGFPPLNLPPPALRGRVQYDNASAVIMAVSRLRERLPVSLASLRQGLQRARVPGRFQVMPGSPTWILDVAHNGPAAQALAENLESLPCGGARHAVLGLLADKEVAAVVNPLRGWVQRWHVAQADDPRAMPAEALAGAVSALDVSGGVTAYQSIAAALSGAAATAGEGDCILAFGSFTTVEGALRCICRSDGYATPGD
jgi:dihydrofolate synthase/folylpolyglutamate synthase